jgi:hypothetical protein
MDTCDRFLVIVNFEAAGCAAGNIDGLLLHVGDHWLPEFGVGGIVAGVIAYLWRGPLARLIHGVYQVEMDIWNGLTAAIGIGGHGTVRINNGRPIRLAPRSELEPLSSAGISSAAFGCTHAYAEPVNLLVTGETVAWLCPACDKQLPAEWSTT